jgi:hypothetical protein
VSPAITAALVVALSAAQDGGTPPAPLSPAPAVAPPAPLIAATFYAWYDHPGAHFVDAAGRDLLRDHFVAPERVHPESPEWFASELSDVADAGLDLLLCASVGTAADPSAPSSPSSPGAPWFPALAAGLERTRGRLARPLGVSLLVEPWILAGQHGGTFDLGDPATRDATLATILAFHRAVRPEDWGHLEGAPLVVFGRVSGGGDGGRGGAEPATFFLELRKQFREAFGSEPFLVLDRSWNREGAALLGDRSWREGSSLLGPQAGAVASLAPGFDDRKLEKPLGVVRPRENGRFYAWAWRQLLGTSHELVIVESWNQLHDGTAIAPALEHGRRYVELTRRYAERLRTGAGPGAAENDREAPLFDGPVGVSDFAGERRFSTRDDVAWRPGDEEGGIALTPDFEASLAFVAAKTGDLLEVRPREKGSAARLAFDVSDSFLPVATPEPLEATVRYTATGEAARLELLGAGEDAAAAGETRTARFEVAAQPSHREARGFDLELRVRGGSIALEEVRLKRTRDRLRAESGEASPFRRIVLDWRELEQTSGRIDEAKLRERLGRGGDATKREPDDAAPREVAVVVLQSPPDWAWPVATHPDAVAATVAHVVAAMAADPSLRLLELFPRANRAGVVGKLPDVQGYVRVLRAASAAAHAAAPNVALVLGAIDGPDVPWLRTIQELKQPFTYDAATFEWNDESGTPGDATCGREFARMLEQWRAGGDGEKPFVVTRRGALGRSEAAASAATATTSLLPKLLRSAWAKLGRTAQHVAVLDEEALPLVHGLPAAQAVAALRGGGLDAVALAAPELERRLADEVPATVLLAQGELFPEELAPKLVPFVDRGGLVVALGGAPFRRPAERLPDGGFVLRDESPIGGDLRDALRIEAAPCDGALTLAVPPTAAELAELRGGALEVAATFARRAGRPRQLQGIHRFEALLDGERDGARVGAIAALVTYSADRRGALLLIGADGGGSHVDDARATEVEAGLHALARKHRALASFVLPEEAPRK